MRLTAEQIKVILLLAQGDERFYCYHVACSHCAIGIPTDAGARSPRSICRMIANKYVHAPDRASQYQSYVRDHPKTFTAEAITEALL